MTPTSTNATRPGKIGRKDRSLSTALGRATPISLVRDDVLDDTPVNFDPELAERGPVTIKRCFDILGALVGLIVCSPVIALTVIAIKLESPGPAFFAHRRLGRAGKLFNCWKFRSMLQDAETQLHADDGLRHHYVSNHFKVPERLDPRITRLGRFLRRSSLDELPQLWNVLCGEMSLVGPRPIVPLESSHYGEDLAALLSVRPGITGAWAVHGRSSVGYPTRVAIELNYVRTWNFTVDLGILVKTPSAVFTQRGAF